MLRRTGTWLSAVWLAALLTIPAAAAQYGSILVETCGGTVALYQVGEVNGQSFVLKEAYGGDALEFDDLLSENLAAWLDGQSKSGRIKAADISGNVLFADLEPGVYLLSQRSAPSGDTPFAPMLVSIPWDGSQWDIHLDMENYEMQPQTSDRGAPELWMLGIFVSLSGLAVCGYRAKAIVRR